MLISCVVKALVKDVARYIYKPERSEVLIDTT